MDYSDNALISTCTIYAPALRFGYEDYGNFATCGLWPLVIVDRNAAFSIFFYVRTTYTPAVVATLLSTRHSNNEGISIGYKASGALTFILQHATLGAIQVDSTGIDIKDGADHFCEIVYTGTSTAAGVSMRHNGAMLGTTTISDTLTANLTAYSTTLHLGVRPGAIGNEGTGDPTYVRDLRIYNYARPLYEHIRTMLFPHRDAGLLSAWLCGEGRGKLVNNYAASYGAFILAPGTIPSVWIAKAHAVLKYAYEQQYKDYLPVLQEPLVFSSANTDIFEVIQSDRSVTVTVANKRGGSVSQRVSHSEIRVFADIAGWLATAALIRASDDAVIAKVNGVLSLREESNTTVEYVVTERMSSALDVMVPKKLLTDSYPSAKIEAGQASQYPIGVPFGYGKKAELVQVLNNGFICNCTIGADSGTEIVTYSFTYPVDQQYEFHTGDVFVFDMYTGAPNVRSTLDVLCSDGTTSLNALTTVDHNGRGTATITDLSSVTTAKVYHREVVIAAGMVNKKLGKLLFKFDEGGKGAGSFVSQFWNAYILDANRQIRCVLINDDVTMTSFTKESGDADTSMDIAKNAVWQYGALKNDTSVPAYQLSFAATGGISLAPTGTDYTFTKFTVEFVLQMTAVGAAFMSLFTRKFSNNQGIILYAVYQSGNLYKIQLGIFDGTGLEVIIPVSTWALIDVNYFALTIDLVGKSYNIIVNGVSVKTGSFTTTLTIGSGGVIQWMTANSGIGWSVSAGSGKLSNIRIWNRILSVAEIYNHRYVVLTGREPSLALHLPAIEGSGTTLLDEVTGNTFTITNGTWVTGLFGTIPYINVYFDGKYVDRSFYSFSGIDDSLTIVFSGVDPSLQNTRVTVDYYTRAYATQIDALAFLLGSSTYGAGNGVAPHSTQSAALAAVGYTVNGGLIGTQRRLKDVADELLVYGTRLSFDDNFDFAFDVDSASDHTVFATPLQSDSDTDQGLITADFASTRRLEVANTERIATFTISAFPDPGFNKNQQTYLLTASRPLSTYGTEKILVNNYIGDIDSATLECFYKSERYRLSTQLSIATTTSLPRFASLALGSLVTFISDFFLTSENMEVSALDISDSGSLDIALTLRRYATSIFTTLASITSVTVKALTSLLYAADFSRTAPPPCTNISLQSSTAVRGTDGGLLSSFQVRAFAPTGYSFTFVRWIMYKTGSALPIMTLDMPATSGEQIDAELTAPSSAGLGFDIAIFAMNDNLSPYNQSEAIYLFNQIATSSTGSALAACTLLTATSKPGGIVELKWECADDAKSYLGGYEVHLRPTSGSYDNTTILLRTRRKTINLSTGTTGITWSYGQTRYFNVRAFPRTNVDAEKGAFATQVSAVITQVVDGDISGVGGGKVGTGISAPNITTGQLTIQSTGATALIITNGGNIQFRVHTASNPGAVEFADGSGNVKSSIVGGATVSTDLTIRGNGTNSGTLSLGYPSSFLDANVQAGQNVKLLAGNNLFTGHVYAEGIGTGNNYFHIKNMDALRVNGPWAVNAVAGAAVAWKLRVESDTGTFLGYLQLFA